MVEFKIQNDKYKILIDGKESSDINLIDYLNAAKLKKKINFNFKALFLGLFCFLLDVVLVSDFVKEKFIVWIIGGIAVFFHYLFFTAVYSIKKIKIKFDGEESDIKLIKEKIKIITASTAPFFLKTVKNLTDHDKKLNSGCERTVKLEKIINKPQKYFKSNILFPCYILENVTICLLPFFILEVTKNGKVFKSSYSKQLSPTRSVTGMRSTEVPKDGRINNKTWAKVNKDGSKDKRFKDNYEVFGIIHDSFYFSATGEIFRLHFFNEKIVSIFSYFSKFDLISPLGNYIEVENDESPSVQARENFLNRLDENKSENSDYIELIINISLAVMNADGEVLDSELTMLKTELIKEIPELDDEVSELIIKQHKKMTEILSRNNKEDISKLFFKNSLEAKRKEKALKVGVMVALADDNFDKSEEEILINISKQMEVDNKIIDEIKENINLKKSNE